MIILEILGYFVFGVLMFVGIVIIAMGIPVTFLILRGCL